MRNLLVTTAVILAFSLPPLAVALWPKEDSAVVVFAASDAAEVVGRAGGTMLALSDDRTYAITRAVDDAPGFRARLKAAGARVVLAAPDDLACLTSASSPVASLTSREQQR
jgi:hypothetical protein